MPSIGVARCRPATRCSVPGPEAAAGRGARRRPQGRDGHVGHPRTLRCLPAFEAHLILAFMLTRRTFLQLVGASTGAATTGSEFLSQTPATAAPALSPQAPNSLNPLLL